MSWFKYGLIRYHIPTANQKLLEFNNKRVWERFSIQLELAPENFVSIIALEDLGRCFFSIFKQSKTLL
jgi:hypothetical protein